MEVVTSPKCSTTSDVDGACSTASIWQDVLAQAVTGELVAALNYTSLAEICEDPDEVSDALEHAESERGHARAFTAEGKNLGIEVPNNVTAKYWKRLRTAFLRQIDARDFIGCLIIQEVMLESFAVASYKRVGQVAPGSLGGTFAAIAAEEEEHIDHAMSILGAARALDVNRRAARHESPALFLGSGGVRERRRPRIGRSAARGGGAGAVGRRDGRAEAFGRRECSHLCDRARAERSVVFPGASGTGQASEEYGSCRELGNQHEAAAFLH